MNISRYALVLLTLWFALMQGMAPLLHAHTAGNTAADDGPHMHMVDIPALHVSEQTELQRFHWHLHADKSLGQVVVLGLAIEQDSPLMALLSALSACWTLAWLPLYSLLAVCISSFCCYAYRQTHPPRYAFIPASPHAPRAPPLA